jgi:thioredoxin reductase (NADPH)
MTGLRIYNLLSGERQMLDVTGLFVFIGFQPNTKIIDGHLRHDTAGYLVTDTSMQSSMPGLFVAGDMRSQLTRQVTTAAGDGTTAAIAVDKYLKALREGSPTPEAQVASSGGYDR